MLCKSYNRNEKHVCIINFLREETKNLYIKGCIFEEEEEKSTCICFVLFFYAFNSKSIIFTYLY